MNRSELSEILALMDALRLTNAPKSIDTKTLEAWFLVLSDLRAEDVRDAVRRLVMTSKWWPAPSEIRSDVTRSRLGIGDAADVLDEILHAIRDRGYTKPPRAGDISSVALAVCDTLGWRTICDSENPEALRAHVLRVAERFVEKAVVTGNLAAAGLLPASPPGSVNRHLPAMVGEVVRGERPSLMLPRNVP